MSSVIVELQREALDKDVRVSDLLRKALVVARKLKLTEFQEWIEKELNGYKDKVPDYRIVTGKVRAWNPYNGWIPIMFNDPVRNIILNWALKLEETGVLGEGLAFSENEKKAAIQNPQNINYFYGPVQSPQIAQGNQQAIQVSSTFALDKEAILKFIEELQAAIGNIELDHTKKSELGSEIATLQAQVSSPNPKKSIVKESLSSIKTILEGAGGSAVGQLLIEVGRMLFS